MIYCKILYIIVKEKEEKIDSEYSVVIGFFVFFSIYIILSVIVCCCGCWCVMWDNNDL